MLFWGNVTNILLSLLIIISLILYGHFLWKRKDMILKSWNVPGPINLPIIGAAYIFMGRPENIHNRLKQMQEKYPQGVKLWFGQKLIYFLHKPEHIEKVLGSHKLVEKDSLYKAAVDSIGEGLALAPVLKWRKHRKIIMTSFRQNILDQFVTVFAEKAYILNTILQKQTRKYIPIYDIILKCMLDTLVETAMKLQLNIQKKDNNYSYTFERIMHLIYIRSVYVWNHFNFLWNLLGYKKQMQAALQIFVDLSDKVIRKKLVQKHNLNEEDSQDLGTKNHKVFLDCIMDSKQFGLNELQEEVNQFLFAGTETTSSTLCFIFAVLGMFQDIQHKVLQEILEIIGPEREPESKDLHRLEYMERVIKETLRLFPVVALFGRSMTEDCDVGDFVIPKLATVYFGVVYIHRNSKYWPDPLKFDPDRFLAEEVAKRPPCAYIPFSYGPRNCIGKNYSFMNMKVLIAVVLRKYKIHCDYKHVEDIQLRTNLVLRFKDDPKVYVTSR